MTANDFLELWFSPLQALTCTSSLRGRKPPSSNRPGSPCSAGERKAGSMGREKGPQRRVLERTRRKRQEEAPHRPSHWEPCLLPRNSSLEKSTAVNDLIPTWLGYATLLKYSCQSWAPCANMILAPWRLRLRQRDCCTCEASLTDKATLALKKNQIYTNILARKLFISKTL